MPQTALAETVTLRNVPLVRVGNWNASVGKGVITADDLTSIVAAAADPEIDRAPIKIGHTGALSDLGDSTPALGWVKNPRIDGDTLYGDIEDVPARFADVLPKAFARRSVEINWGVKTPGGKTYPASLRALALLGVQPPAVKGLADIVEMYEPTAAAEGAVSVFALEDPTASMFDALEQSRGPQTPPVHDDHTNKEGHVAELDTRKLREALGLPEAASDLEVLAAWHAQVPAGEPAKPDPEPKPAAQAEPEGTEGKTPELVTLSQSAFAELQAQANQGAEAREILKRQEIDSIVTSALSEGKFTVAEQAEYRSLLETNFAAGQQLISKLTPGKVPVAPVGGHDDSQFAGISGDDLDEELKTFFGADLKEL